MLFFLSNKQIIFYFDDPRSLSSFLNPLLMQLCCSTHVCWCSHSFITVITHKFKMASTVSLYPYLTPFVIGFWSFGVKPKKLFLQYSVGCTSRDMIVIWESALALFTTSWVRGCLRVLTKCLNHLVGTCLKHYIEIFEDSKEVEPWACYNNWKGLSDWSLSWNCWMLQLLSIQWHQHWHWYGMTFHNYYFQSVVESIVLWLMI